MLVERKAAIAGGKSSLGNDVIRTMRFSSPPIPSCRRRLAHSVVAFATVCLTACGGEEAPTEPEPANQAPEAVGTIPDQTVAEGESAVVNLSLYFSDPDGDELTYEASSNDPAVATASVSGSALTISGVAVGRARVTASATDGSLSARQVIFVSVESTAAGICGRTEQVVAAILGRIRDVSDCALVTEAHLAAIDGRIDLGSSGITSLKPGDFAGLSSLRELTITDNPLTVLQDEMFAGLRSLETLWLFNNRLITLPRAAFFELSELTELRLTNNLLSSLEEGMFIGLATLQSLHLNGNRLTSLPDRVFAGMPVLEEMHLARNQLRSITREAFSGLPLLRRLFLYENGLEADGLPDGVFADLISLWFLDLAKNQLTELSGGEFSGLGSLGSLDLSENLLTSLPEGAFAGMSRLFSLWLHDNPVDPLQLVVSLESAGEGRFRARVHTGAPFEMILPINVANGNMDGGNSVTIARGSVESRVVTVTRTAGTTGAVTVDLGALPGLPPGRYADDRGAYHRGYELARSADLPLQVFPAASANQR
ncbi:MAG: leucine-rich repeat protein [Gammaproteobacteria bacterium]|nr:leucine-rich repeat protein [Gammaproteobacteria bacterium]MDE0258528.1 leucine-rich repeat protein [Gammaproteobacteria bacterium]